jgi:predicted house-cleaning noncanonical NTP pyrophosphatase (MazG superfamily)
MTITEGHKIKTRQLSKAELPAAILGKIPEELAELKEAYAKGSDEAEKKEIADLKTLVEAYISARGFSLADIEVVAKQKITKRGGFAEGYWVEWIDLNDGSADGRRLLKKFRGDTKNYIEEKK